MSDQRTIINARNPRYADDKGEIIILEVEFKELSSMGYITFIANPRDIAPHGRKLYQDALDGKYGKIAPYIASSDPKPKVILAATPPNIVG